MKLLVGWTLLLLLPRNALIFPLHILKQDSSISRQMSEPQSLFNPTTELIVLARGIEVDPMIEGHSSEPLEFFRRIRIIDVLHQEQSKNYQCVVSRGSCFVEDENLRFGRFE